MKRGTINVAFYNASDEDINKILKMMGKYEASDELNCGVCGYDTCRRKAQAVYEGMAEISMCLHHMRTKAESLTNMIFENTPNIILILDGNMNIKELNHPGENIFKVRSIDVKGSHVSQLFDGSEYYRVKDTRNNVYRHKISLPQYGVILMEDILYLEKQDIILGIMTDITAEETGRRSARG
jgi:transcriptional regulator with PAS, ATPase and Fis domain